MLDVADVCRDAVARPVESAECLRAVLPVSRRLASIRDTEELIRALAQELGRFASFDSHTFSTRTPATRDAADFTPRILPYHVLAPPPEIRRILWQR